MLPTRLCRIISNSKRSISFFQTPKILTPKNWIVLNQAFVSSSNEKPNTVFDENLGIGRKYYRNYLLNNAEYANLLFSQDAISNTKTAAILSQLEQEEDNFSLKEELSNYLNKELSQFSFSEICEVTFLILKFLRQNDRSQDPFWDEILQRLNEECFGRIVSWTLNEMIKMTDVLLVFPRLVQCKMKLLFKLMRKSRTKHEMVLLHYFLMETRKTVSKEYKFKIQMRTNEIISELNLTEIGIICEGILKGFPVLHKEDLLYNILAKVSEEVETIDKNSFSSVCKFARVISHSRKCTNIAEFQEKSTKTALKLGVPYLISLARTSENCSYLDSNLKNILMKEVKDHINELSLFSIERVAFINTLINIHDEEFLKLAVNAFESVDEIEKKKKILLLFLASLRHYRVYPKRLFDIVFKQELVDTLVDENIPTVSAWWQIYCNLAVERPEYITFEILPKTRYKVYQLAQSQWRDIYPKHSSRLWLLRKKLGEIFGEEAVEYFMPLPQYQLGLLMRFDKNSKVQRLPTEFESFKRGFIIKPLKDDHVWMFVFIAHSLVDDVESVPNLILQTQLRELNAIGYVPVPVPQLWVNKYSENKKLENLMNAKLQEHCKDQKSAVIN